MTTKITTVYDAIITKLGTLYPSKTRLPIPENIQANNALFLVDGYGIRIDNISHSTPEFCSILSEYSVTIILTRELWILDTDVSNDDTVKKNLLEDNLLAVKMLNDVSKLNLGNNADSFTIRSNSGIKTLGIDKKKFKYIELNFNFKIRENQ